MFFQPDLVGITSLHPRREFHHWCPKSEQFASTSHLMSAILQGWQVNTTVIRRLYHFGGGRQSSVYYFELRRRSEYMTMPVLESPTTIRLMTVNPFEIVDYRQRRQIATYASFANTNRNDDAAFAG